jgi:DNA-directed RNA polymerase beta' subunit
MTVIRKNEKPLVFLIAFVLFLAVTVYAQEAIKEEKSVQQESADEELELEINPEAIEKRLGSYKLNIQRIIKEAQKNIKKVDEELRQAEILKSNQEEPEKNHLAPQGNETTRDETLRQEVDTWSEFTSRMEKERLNRLEEAEKALQNLEKGYNSNTVLKD